MKPSVASYRLWLLVVFALGLTVLLGARISDTSASAPAGRLFDSRLAPAPTATPSSKSGRVIGVLVVALWLILGHNALAGRADAPLPSCGSEDRRGLLYVLGDGCQVLLFGQNQDLRHYKSFDGGMTWQCLESPNTPMPSPTPTPPEVPEGSTLLLLGSGLAGLAGYLWRKRRAFSK